MKYVFFLVALVANAAFADVKSTEGIIRFSTQLNQPPEMILNDRGLGIGATPSANLQVIGNAIISQQLFIGGDHGSSNLNINGTMMMSSTSANTDGVLGDHSVVFAGSSSDNITLTLPYAGNVKGRVYYIKKTLHDNYIEIYASEGVELGQNIILTTANSSYPSVQLVSDESQWLLLNINGNIETDAFASDNLVMYLKFDSTGDVKDYGPYNLVATRNNFETSGNGYVNGKVRDGLQFDGVNDYLSIPDNAVLDFSTAITSTVWFRRLTPSPGTNALSEFDIIFSKGLGYLYFPRIEESDKVMTQLYFSDGSSTPEIETGFITDDDWHFVACTFDSSSGEISIFIDGELSHIESGYIGKVIQNTANNLGIGGQGNAFNGILDELRLYNRALSESELKNIYNATKTGI